MPWPYTNEEALLYLLRLVSPIVGVRQMEVMEFVIHAVKDRALLMRGLFEIMEEQNVPASIAYKIGQLVQSCGQTDVGELLKRLEALKPLPTCDCPYVRFGDLHRPDCPEKQSVKHEGGEAGACMPPPESEPVGEPVSTGERYPVQISILIQIGCICYDRIQVNGRRSVDDLLGIADDKMVTEEIRNALTRLKLHLVKFEQEPDGRKACCDADE